MGEEEKKKKEVKVPEFAEGTVLKGSGEAIYVYQGGKKRVIPDLFTFIRMAISGDVIEKVKDSVLEAIPDGPPMPQIKRRGKPSKG